MIFPLKPPFIEIFQQAMFDDTGGYLLKIQPHVMIFIAPSSPKIPVDLRFQGIGGNMSSGKHLVVAPSLGRQRFHFRCGEPPGEPKKEDSIQQCPFGKNRGAGLVYHLSSFTCCI